MNKRILILVSILIAPILSVILIGFFKTFKWNFSSSHAKYFEFIHPSSAAIVLADSRVLLIGAHSTAQRGWAQIYNPNTNMFEDIPGPSYPRDYHPVACLLEDGRVLVTGGPPDSIGVSVLEVFNPVNNKWTEVGRLPDKCSPYDVTPLVDGRILFSFTNNDRKGLVVWNQTTKSAVVVNIPSTSICGAPLLTNLDNEKTLITQVTYNNVNPSAHNTFIFDCKDNKIALGPRMVVSRWNYQATRLLSKDVFITGGDEPSLSTETYYKVQNIIKPTIPIPSNFTIHRAVVLVDGRVLLAGRIASSQHTSSSMDPVFEAELYDPQSGKFMSVHQPPSALLLGDGPKGGVHHQLSNGEVLFFSRLGPIRFSPQTLGWEN